jgi:hypothetical protein
VITRAVGSCDELPALIGDQWVTITDEHGRRCLDDPDDFVRLEIEAAMTRSVRVIPILVGGARMPRAEELPDSLAKLVRCQPRARALRRASGRGAARHGRGCWLAVATYQTTRASLAEFDDFVVEQVA